MPSISLFYFASQLFVLAYASIPRPSIGHTSLNITLGKSREEAHVWVSVSGQTFVEYALVAQHPNGSYQLASSVAAVSLIQHNTFINESGVPVVIPTNPEGDTMCLQSNGGAYLDGFFKPPRAGNYSLIPYFLYYFQSGSDEYRYPNSSTVCVDTPPKVEVAAAPKLSLLVKEAVPGATPTQTSTPSHTPVWANQPITEVSLTPEPTGDVFHLTPSLGMLTVLGPSIWLLGALALSISILL
ncbi:SubName: Full=Uncharacterized protein {ECO:0000313/EMBL:CCA68782.1} [Serendipita indica DSM 11827]|nr:SubName: Full=Uncharacterized protein {ECO:0000313/EMBL:CCA68782.1} [Serendipita indica DSM 11827]